MEDLKAKKVNRGCREGRIGEAARTAVSIVRSFKRKDEEADSLRSREKG